MNNKLLSFILITLFISICGTAVCSAENVLSGEYELITISYNGSEMNPGSMSISSFLKLNEDGSGVLSMNGGDTEITKWTAGEGTVSLFNTEGVALECGYDNGILALEMGENYYWNYYHESINPNAGKEASRLIKVLEDIDAAAGAHISYKCHTDYLDAASVVDVHTKDSSYYSKETMIVSGHESVKANAFIDDTMYLLYPDKLTGSVVMTISLKLLDNNVLMLDDCYKAVFGRALRKDYTVEERDIDGKKYTVEVFPADGVSEGAAFYFDENDQLIHILKDAPAAMPSLGETFYTINSIDKAADESLFDLSAYTIE